LDAMLTGSNPKNLQILKNKNYKFVKGDICNKYLIEKLAKDVDYITNFAAESHVDRSIQNPTQFINSNFLGVFNLLQTLRKKKDIKFIQISTDEVYGEKIRGTFFEEDPLNPSNPYSASKASAEMLIKSYIKTYDIDAAITRCVNNFGPRQYPEKLIPKTILCALNNKKIPIHGKGRSIRQWIYVQDHCDAIINLILKSPKSTVYNIPGNYEDSNLKVVKKILDLMNITRDLITFVEDRPGQDKRYSISSTRSQKELDFKSKISFEKGLETTIEWYSSNKSWWKNLKF